MNRSKYMKEYRLKNKDKIKEYNETYFQENKEEIRKKRSKSDTYKEYQMEYQNTRVKCVCNKELLRSNLYNHRKVCITYKNLSL